VVKSSRFLTKIVVGRRDGGRGVNSYLVAEGGIVVGVFLDLDRRAWRMVVIVKVVRVVGRREGRTVDCILMVGWNARMGLQWVLYSMRYAISAAASMPFHLILIVVFVAAMSFSFSRFKCRPDVRQRKSFTPHSRLDNTLQSSSMLRTGPRTQIFAIDSETYGIFYLTKFK